LTKNRKKPSFEEWSRSKDPEGKAWGYLPDTQRYALVEVQKSSWEEFCLEQIKNPSKVIV
jgi:hypothetical protein